MRRSLSLAAVTSFARALPLSTGYGLADALSYGHRRLCPSRRRAVEANLRALGESGDALQTAVRGIFRNYGRNLFEFLRGPDVAEVACSLHGREHLDRALDEGRGVVLAVPHTGNWGIAGARLGRGGVRLHAIAGVQLRSRWSEELRRRQAESGVSILPPTIASYRRMPDILRAGGALALLIDGSSFRRGIEVPFCGRRAAIPVGPARLAARTGAALLPSYCLRRPDGTLSARILPEVPVPDARSETLSRATAELAARLEPVLRSHPDQWLLFRSFFRRSTH